MGASPLRWRARMCVCVHGCALLLANLSVPSARLQLQYGVRQYAQRMDFSLVFAAPLTVCTGVQMCACACKRPESGAPSCIGTCAPARGCFIFIFFIFCCFPGGFAVPFPGRQTQREDGC